MHRRAVDKRKKGILIRNKKDKKLYTGGLWISAKKVF
jgi:hypothetical protein